MNKFLNKEKSPMSSLFHQVKPVSNALKGHNSVFGKTTMITKESNEMKIALTGLLFLIQ